MGTCRKSIFSIATRNIHYLRTPNCIICFPRTFWNWFLQGIIMETSAQMVVCSQLRWRNVSGNANEITIQLTFPKPTPTAGCIIETDIQKMPHDIKQNVTRIGSEIQIRPCDWKIISLISNARNTLFLLCKISSILFDTLKAWACYATASMLHALSQWVHTQISP